MNTNAVKGGQDKDDYLVIADLTLKTYAQWEQEIYELYRDHDYRMLYRYDSDDNDNELFSDVFCHAT